MELTIAAVACAGSGVICGIPVQRMREDIITELDLSNSGIHVAAAMLVAYLFPATLVLKNCNLLNNSLNVESATMLAKIGAEKGIMLSGMARNQTGANLSGQNPADTILIVSDLQFMPVLTSLDLRLNHIGDEGAKAIAEALKVNPVLTILRLDGNGIGDDGAKAIAEALKVNPVLNNLDLRFNSIGDDGAKAIAEALKVNPVLTILDLGDNKNIGANGAKAIAEALKVNPVLTNLNLRYNEIRDNGAKAIAEALKVNQVLTNLDLEYNNLGYAGQKAVRDAVKDRSGFELQL